MSQGLERSCCGQEGSLKDTMLSLIKNRSAVLCVMGLGYVGLPLALLFVKEGFEVLGYDINDQYVDSLRSGLSSVSDVSSDALQRALATGRFRPTSHVREISEAHIYLICVPTPLAKTRQPDLSCIHTALNTLVSVWRPGKMVILESTTYPGTTDEILLTALSNGSLQVDKDFLLAFSPERVDPGNKDYPLEVVPKVVGGVTPTSTSVAAALYETVFACVHQVSSARVAELTKLLENTFRNVNIAFVNEFAQICEALGVDVWEVIDAAKTKPFGFMPFYPGAGIGGHCIPLDPQYLVYRTRLEGYEPRLVALADQINQEMPRYVCRRAAEQLNAKGRAIRGSKILILGVSYKPDVPDTRESPAYWIIEYLRQQGADVAYHDPQVPNINVNQTQYWSRDLSPVVLEESDLIVIVTAHSSFDYGLLAHYKSKILDTCNGMKRVNVT